MCGVSVKRTLSNLSSSDKEDADVLSVTVLFQLHAMHAKHQQAIVGWKPAGPEDLAHRLLSPLCSRHPALPFGATVICSRLLQNRVSPALIEWLVSNVVAGVLST